MLLRRPHVISVAVWVGSSFQFVWLGNCLIEPKSPDLLVEGVDGALWAAHGGGFCSPQKDLRAPRKIPTELHWFYRGSSSTWLAGLAQFTVHSLWNAGSFRVDRSVPAWTPAGAVAAALDFKVALWRAYDLICRTLGQREDCDVIVGAAVAVTIVLSSRPACRWTRCTAGAAGSAARTAPASRCRCGWRCCPTPAAGWSWADTTG